MEEVKEKGKGERKEKVEEMEEEEEEGMQKEGKRNEKTFVKK